MSIVRKLIVLFLLSAIAQQSYAKGELVISGEFGSEIDTNPSRVTGVDILRDDDSVEIVQSYDGQRQTLAPLLRAIGGIDFRWLLTDTIEFSANYGFGAKAFLSEVGKLSNEFIQHASMGFLFDRKRYTLGIRSNYYDAFLKIPENCNLPGLPCPLRRDFRRGDVSTRILWGKNERQFSISLGGLFVEFKPTDYSSFSSLYTQLSFRQNFKYETKEKRFGWGFGLSYRPALRRFWGNALDGVPCGESLCGEESIDRRYDVYQRAKLSLFYLAHADAELYYAFVGNHSNSFGEDFIRHILGFQFTSRLIEDFFLTMQLVYQFSSFQDPQFIQLSSQNFIDTETENRSRLLLQLGRDINDEWRIFFRYALYLNESGQLDSGEKLPGFFRQSFLLGLSFEYDLLGSN